MIFIEASLLNKISSSGIIGLLFAHICLKFDQGNVEMICCDDNYDAFVIMMEMRCDDDDEAL